MFNIIGNPRTRRTGLALRGLDNQRPLRAHIKRLSLISWQPYINLSDILQRLSRVLMVQSELLVNALKKLELVQVFLRNVEIEPKVPRLASIHYSLVLGLLQPLNLSLLLYVNGTLPDASDVGLELTPFQFVSNVLHRLLSIA